MKKLFIYSALFLALFISCRKIVVDSNTSTATAPTTTTENTILEGRIAANLTLKAGYTYKLRGLVYIGVLWEMLQIHQQEIILK